MPESLLSYLTRPNPRVTCRGSGSSTFTFNDSWSPVEALEPWNEFTYTNLVSTFRHDLDNIVDLNNPTPQCEAANFNEVYNEQMLGHLVASAIMIPVSSALPNELFLTGGGRTWKNLDCFPDWSAGNKFRFQENSRSKATALGDTKYKWRLEDAIRLIRSSPDGYEQLASRDLVRPIEQVQYYCASYKCRFGFLITEEGLLAIEAYQDTDIQRSPRPRRNIQPQPHRRVPSSTTVDMSLSGESEDLTDMSVTSLNLTQSIRLLKYAFVPWEANGAGRLTVKLALYCIARIANEASELRPDYAPFTTLSRPSAASPRQASAPTKPTGAPEASSKSAEKGKARATSVEEPTPSTGTLTLSDVPKFIDVVVTWNNNHNGYRYNHDGKWVLNDSPESWHTVGVNIYKYGPKPPHLRSKKPA